MKYLYNGNELSVSAEPDGDGWRVTLPDGTVQPVRAQQLPGSLMELTLPPASRRVRVAVARTDRGIEVSYGGAVYVFAPATERSPTRKPEASSGELVAPMPGVVADVSVEEGQEVAAYQTLAVVEAMKVMATVEAPFAGVVSRVHVAKGQQVKLGDPLIDLRKTE